jgi:Saxitoxin biosynthesis operon protein SxtJ
MATVLEPRIDRGPAPESSDRSFGYVFAVFFVIVGCWPFLYWDQLRWWALAIALAFAAVAAVQPRLLRPLNRAWLAFGRALHKVMSPTVMGLIFFACVTPTGWIMRLRGKDLLTLKRDPALKSYWIDRQASPIDAQSMKNQF